MGYGLWEVCGIYAAKINPIPSPWNTLEGWDTLVNLYVVLKYIIYCPYLSPLEERNELISDVMIPELNTQLKNQRQQRTTGEETIRSTLDV